MEQLYGIYHHYTSFDNLLTKMLCIGIIFRREKDATVAPTIAEWSKPDMQVIDSMHRGVVVEISRGLRDNNGHRVNKLGDVDQAGRSNVGSSIKAIVSAGSLISDLTAKTRTYEKIIFGLNKAIAEHRSTEEGFYQRAIKAEARAKDAEDQIRRLEMREKTAMDHLDRAMKAVDTSFAFSPRLDLATRARF